MESKTERQKEILSVSLSIISKRGIQGLTIKNLSREIGVTEGAIYRHFDSKMDIISGIATSFKLGSTRVLEKILTSDNKPLEKIRNFFLGQCDQFAKNPALVSVLFTDDWLIGHDSLRLQIQQTILAHKNRLLGVIKEAQKQGAIESIDPAHIFITVMGSLRLLVNQWRSGGYTFDLKREGERLWRSLQQLITNN